MTDGPNWGDTAGPKEMVRTVATRQAMTYELVHKEAGGTVVAQFSGKTLADGTANRWNADLGSIQYYVRKIR